MGLPLAHIAGVPVEETLAAFAPALLLAFGAASATLRARLRRARFPAGDDARTQDRAGRADDSTALLVDGQPVRR